MAAIAICNQNCYLPGEIMWDVEVESDGVPRYSNGKVAHDAIVVSVSEAEVVTITQTIACSTVVHY